MGAGGPVRSERRAARARGPSALLSLAVLALLAPILGAGGGCADRAALEAERDRLEAEVLRRQVILADLDTFRAEVSLLERRLAVMRQALERVDLRLLGAGLIEQAATGRLERQEGQPDRVVLEGAGQGGDAAAALEVASDRAGGLKLSSLVVEGARWRAECQLSEPLPEVPAAEAPPPVELPGWPQATELVAEIERLRRELDDADARIGVSLEALEQRRWEANLLVHRLSEPDRLARAEPVVSALFGGARPLMTTGELRPNPSGWVGQGRLSDGRTRGDLLAALTAHGAAEVEDGAEGQVTFQVRPAP